MNIIKKLLIIVLTLILVIACFTTISHGDNFDIGAFENKTEAEGFKNFVNDTSGTVISVARIICATTAIVILLVIAMKYMISAPGDRADIKKHAVHYVISAVILFGLTGVLTIIGEFASVIGNVAGE